MEICVVGAVILEDGKVLCAQRGAGRSQAGLWEFPGGKVEVDEDPQSALVREIEEELDCIVAVGDPVTTTRHAYESLVVVLTTYWCALVAGRPSASEHSRLVWLTADELVGLDWAPADMPAVEEVRATLLWMAQPDSTDGRRRWTRAQQELA
ncbi:MAG: (deoxy)nucleoside triphosphate pyrophosphohydrolase [Nocardioidaceae bacterium]|nr:(deoxy)nucleoside triphosphate pyrophosphohydrolase [Nocardioidaceae bacterium]